MNNVRLEQQYRELMLSYLQGKEEKKLYAAQQLSKMMLEEKISPEELVSYHTNAMKSFGEELPPFVLDSFDFLLEVIMGYGLAYREHLSLRHKQQELTSELEVAASMQQSLLPSGSPEIEGLDIGVVSVPANQMSGDYYNFVHYDQDRLGVAIADIIGKGIPAALCMSMIKYAMDGLHDQQLMPKDILRNLNHIVERNVDPGMFITMISGIYDVSQHRFLYAGAGHEPGFFYDREGEVLLDLEVEGLVLGVARHVHYAEYRVDLNPGDAVILFSDGVTECRTDEGFLERSQLKGLIQQHMAKGAQDLAEAVFEECLRLSNFEQCDDHTMLLIRRSK